MWATACRLRKNWPEVVWSLFAASNIAVSVFVAELQMAPLLLVWVSLVVVYTLRRWPLRPTVLVLCAVMLTTGVAKLIGADARVTRDTLKFDEWAELPLLAIIFLTILWHTRSRQPAELHERFAHEFWHQFRTIVTVARGHAELIQTECRGKQAAVDASVIIEELNCLSRISDQILALGVADHPRLLRLSPIDLEPFILTATRRWSRTVRRRWHVDVDTTGTLLVDAERLHSALDALIENAVKFTREQDRISIVCSAVNDSAVIEVSDTGPGIPPEDLPRVFEPFFRAGGDMNGNGGGLGLALVKAVAEAHRGTVSVASEPGEGAAFRLQLPGFEPDACVPGDLPQQAALETADAMQ